MTRHRFEPAWLLCAALLWGGCVASDDDDTGDDDDDTGTDDDDSGDDDDSTDDCDRYNTFGYFAVTSAAEHGGFSGGYYDNPWPFTLDELLREGDCGFFSFAAPPFCDPPCESPLMCGFGNECRPQPEGQPLGTLSVAGTNPSLQLEAQAGNYYYTTESYPNLLPPGNTATLTKPAGGLIDAFQLSATGVAPLTWGWDSIQMVQHQDMVVTWDAVDGAGGGTIVLHMDIDHHAVMEAYVECEADDAAGSLTVDATLVDALIESGHSGIGTYVENAWMARINGQVRPTNLGCVGFRAESMVWIYPETVLDE